MGSSVVVDRKCTDVPVAVEVVGWECTGLPVEVVDWECTGIPAAVEVVDWECTDVRL